MNAVAFLLASILGYTPGALLNVCSTSVFSPHLRTGEVYILGVADGATYAVPFAEPPRNRGPVQIPEPEAYPDSTLAGWLVEVEQLAGSTGDLPQETVEVLLVPWVYGPDCRTRPWPRDQRWLQPQQRGIFSAEVRPLTQQVDGRVVMDVFLASHQPYPDGEFLVYEARRGRGTDAPWLTIDEYWSLVRALPTEELRRTAPEEARALLRNWGQSNREAAGRFPASLILERARFEIPFDRRE